MPQIGQELLNVPFPDLVRNLGLAIAEAQMSLDVTSMRLAQFMAGYVETEDENGNVTVTEKKVKFSGPESSVEMDVMSGFGGKPVQIKNLPNPAYQDYTQYKSVTHTHSSDKAKWSHSGTNGFTSTMDVGSDR